MIGKIKPNSALLYLCFVDLKAAFDSVPRSLHLDPTAPTESSQGAALENVDAYKGEGWEYCL